MVVFRDETNETEYELIFWTQEKNLNIKTIK